ncbi:MAG: AraC family transcriptional regulator [Akkermansiaceae bacterium]|nr:AraC family transcriptional regulator [Akkermansiaceae bacterium]
MSYSTRGHTNKGAYDQPFSGVGVEFDPLGAPPDRTGVTLHESGYLPDNTDWNFPSVLSPFWRLMHNRRPGHCVLFGDEMTELTRDRLVLIPPHQYFHCLGQNPVPACWLAFSFTRRLEAAHYPVVVLRPHAIEISLIRALCRLIETNETWAPTAPILHHSLALLHVVLCRPELRWRAPAPPMLERARLQIEQHFTTAPSNPELAATRGMSLTGFTRAFRREFSTTPASYMTGVRVREAALLLLQTDATIEAIAERTGFPNRAYFSRVFQKVTGESPAGFRRKHRPC